MTTDGAQVSLGLLILIIGIIGMIPSPERGTSYSDGHRQERIAEWNTAAAEWAAALSTSPFGGMRLVAQCSTGLALGPTV